MPKLISSSPCSARQVLASWAAPLVNLCRLYSFLERAPSWAETRYAKNEDPMECVLISIPRVPGVLED
jgi:hypothetical protein